MTRRKGWKVLNISFLFHIFDSKLQEKPTLKILVESLSFKVEKEPKYKILNFVFISKQTKNHLNLSLLLNIVTKRCTLKRGKTAHLL